MTYFPELSILQAEGERTNNEFLPPHIITDFGGGGDMQLHLRNGADGVGIFFRCQNGGGISVKTCGGIGRINAGWDDKKPENHVEIGKTLWRPGDDGGGLLACKMQDTNTMVLTIVGTHFNETNILTALITREQKEGEKDIPIIQLGDRFELVTQLPHCMLADWETGYDRLKSLRGKSVLQSMDEGERFISPAKITDEVHRILKLYHAE